MDQQEKKFRNMMDKKMGDLSSKEMGMLGSMLFSFNPKIVSGPEIAGAILNGDDPDKIGINGVAQPETETEMISLMRNLPDKKIKDLTHSDTFMLVSMLLSPGAGTPSGAELRATIGKDIREAETAVAPKPAKRPDPGRAQKNPK